MAAVGHADKRSASFCAPIPNRTAVRIPPAFPALPKPERTNSQSLRAAVMPQDRRSSPSATQDTNQPPIVRPHSATLSPSAFLVGCCDRSSSPPSQRRNPTAAAAILRTCGRPAVRSAGIRTQRVDHPPAIGDPHRGELGPWIRGRITGPLLGPTRDEPGPSTRLHSLATAQADHQHAGASTRIDDEDGDLLIGARSARHHADDASSMGPSGAARCFFRGF